MRATRRDWIGLAVLALPCLVYSMDLTVLNLALPAISAQLKPSSAQLLWIVDAYGFLVAGLLITMGTLGDRIGRRRVLLAGAAAFALASVLAASARSAEMLIAMRALLGIAGATLAPSTLSLIRNMFHDAHERQFAIGVWVASFSLGAAIGPLVGGALLQYFSWGAVFLVAVPVMGLLLAAGPWLLPEYRDPDAGAIDLVSVAQSLAAVLGVVYAVKRIAESGIAWDAVALLAAGASIGAMFVRRQRRLAYPLLDVTLFHQPRFRAAIAAYALTSLAMFGIYIFVTQYLQLVLGLAPLEAGLATLPWALTFVVGSLAAPRLTRYAAPETILLWGLAIAAIGFVPLVFVDAADGLALVLASTIIMSAGMAPVVTVGNEMIITAAPPERAGAASALSETSSELSGALGIALIGSAGTVLYRSTLEKALPDGLSPAAANEALATLGGALAAADALPALAGDALRSAATAAFTSALQLTAWVGAASLLVGAVTAAGILRTKGPRATGG